MKRLYFQYRFVRPLGRDPFEMEYDPAAGPAAFERLNYELHVCEKALNRRRVEAYHSGEIAAEFDIPLIANYEDVLRRRRLDTDAECLVAQCRDYLRGIFHDALHEYERGREPAGPAAVGWNFLDPRTIYPILH